jgi:hypothetical protein
LGTRREMKSHSMGLVGENAGDPGKSKPALISTRPF